MENQRFFQFEPAHAPAVPEHEVELTVSLSASIMVVLIQICTFVDLAIFNSWIKVIEVKI
jgi:hypothetical protein